MTDAVAGRPDEAARDKFARILLVEDQPEVAGSLSRILEMWGHRVTILRDGAAALRELTNSADNFDVCITDLNMPGATGFDVVRMIREKKLPLKVIVMGGYLTGPIRQDLEAATVDAIVPKPFSMDDLEAAIRVSGW